MTRRPGAPVRRGDLEEQLLEVARGPGEASRPAGRRGRCRRAAGPTRRRRRGSRARSCRPRGSRRSRRPGPAANRVAGRLEGLALEQQDRMRSTAPKRRRRSMSLTVPWARTWPRSTIATLVHSSSSSGRMWLLMRIVLPSDPQLAEQLAQLDPGARVEAGRRLVEEQDLRVVDEGVGEAQPLLHAARERLDVVVALVGEVHQLEQVADHPSPRGGRQAVAAREEVQVLPDLHVVVDPEDVRHEPEDAPDLVRVPCHGPAGDLRVAGRRLQEGRQDPERRGLAGAVRPDQAEDLALPRSTGPRRPRRASSRSA